MHKPCEHSVTKPKGKPTRFEVIHDLIQAQSGVQAGVHHLQLDKAYLRCTECRSYILARCNARWDLSRQPSGKVISHHDQDWQCGTVH